jgi:hypothetical protein
VGREKQGNLRQMDSLMPFNIYFTEKKMKRRGR